MTTQKPKTFQCCHCNKTKPVVDQAETEDGKSYCEYCFYMYYGTCASCKEVSPLSDGFIAGNGTFLCQKCKAERTFVCSYCETAQEMQNIWKKTPEGCICGNCKHNYEMEADPPPIASYSFKPKARFRGRAPNKLFLGFELEVDRQKYYESGGVDSRSSQEDLRTFAKGVSSKIKDDAGNVVYIKSDSSVPYGFEIVSHPMSVDYIRSHPKLFDPIFDLVKKKFCSHDSGRCGMHIHMSKDAFSTLQLFKFMKFFQDEKRFVIKVSQRGGENAYAAFGNHGDALKKMAKEKSGNAERHLAINLQNKRTIEVRVFRGTLKKERFYKNLEFCMALYEFCGIVTTKDCTMKNFLGYVYKNRGEFPNLYAFLDERYKFTVLSKPIPVNRRGKLARSQSPAIIRYEGERTPNMGEPDVPDAEWAEVMALSQDRRSKEIADRIAKSKNNKEAKECA